MDLERHSGPPARLHCLDNLRYLLVLAVVAFHSTSAYVGATYFVMDPHPHGLTRALNHFLSSFAMVVLFFVAGYFTLPSLRSKGVAGFLAGRFTRLGVPLVLGVLFLAPISTYIAYAAQGFQGLESPGYWRFWLAYMRTIPAFPTARLGGDAFCASTQFHYHHFWFLALLLGLSVGFALVWGLYRRLRPTRAACGPSPAAGNPQAANAQAALAVVICGGLSALSGSVGQMLAAIPGMRPLLNILGTSPWQLPSMALYFGLGIHAYRQRWFVDGTHPGSLAGWVAAWLLLQLAEPLGLRLSWEFMQDAVYIGLLASLSARFLDRTSRIHAALAASSYPIYVVHFPIVVLVQFLLLGTGLPTPAKFLVTAVSGGLLSFLISHYLIRPFPRGAAAALLVLFAAMSLGLHPQPSAAVASPAPAPAEPRWRPRDHAEVARMRLRWYDEQLGLSEAQEAALRPLIEAQVRAQMAAEQQLRDTLESLLDAGQRARLRQTQRW